jgi:CHAT domain-containing protein
VSAIQSCATLPFDLGRAQVLYKQLFGKVGDLIAGKRLLIVPTGPLSTLPFQVLVTEPPAGKNGYAGAAWLGARQPISVLPSVGSIRSFRAYARAGEAKRPYIGFGNPLLEGDSRVDAHGKLAQTARNLKRCSDAAKQQVASSRQARRPVAPLSTANLADRNFIRALTPLPETAEELCKVAQSLGVGEDDVRLGAKATERDVKALSASNALANYKILHFASHGALAGEVQGSAEAGLVLTPPDRAREGDDGFLSASEIAQLRLDADWVILSACNTAGASSNRSEALSGVARAFFYAGARAILVSHWAVDLLATVRLVTGTMSALSKNPGMGRAQAHQIAVRDMIASGGVLAHPAFWAPFVVVGEGGK